MASNKPGIKKVPMDKLKKYNLNHYQTCLLLDLLELISHGNCLNQTMSNVWERMGYSRKDLVSLDEQLSDQYFAKHDEFYMGRQAEEYDKHDN